MSDDIKRLAQIESKIDSLEWMAKRSEERYQSDILSIKADVKDAVNDFRKVIQEIMHEVEILQNARQRSVGIKEAVFTLWTSLVPFIAASLGALTMWFVSKKQ